MSVEVLNNKYISLLADGILDLYFNKNNKYGIRLPRKSRKIIYTECKNFNKENIINPVNYINLCIALHELNLKAYNTRYKKSIKEFPEEYLVEKYSDIDFYSIKYTSIFKKYNNNPFSLSEGYYKLLKLLNKYLYQISGEIPETDFYRTLDELRNNLYEFIFKCLNPIEISNVNEENLSISDIRSISEALYKLIYLGFNYCQIDIPSDIENIIVSEVETYCDRTISTEKSIFLALYYTFNTHQKSYNEISEEYRNDTNWKCLLSSHKYENYHNVVVENDYSLIKLLTLYLYKSSSSAYKNLKFFKAIKDLRHEVIKFTVLNTDTYEFCNKSL